MSVGRRRRLAYLLLLRDRHQDDAALRAREPRKVMPLIGGEDDVPVSWQVDVVQFMCCCVMDRSHPDEYVGDWLDSAPPGREAYYKWAAKAWTQVRVLNWMDVMNLYNRMVSWRDKARPSWEVHKEHLPTAPKPPINGD